MRVEPGSYVAAAITNKAPDADQCWSATTLRREFEVTLCGETEGLLHFLPSQQKVVIDRFSFLHGQAPGICRHVEARTASFGSKLFRLAHRAEPVEIWNRSARSS
jgi:hypothetical protein